MYWKRDHNPHEPQLERKLFRGRSPYTCSVLSKDAGSAHHTLGLCEPQWDQHGLLAVLPRAGLPPPTRLAGEGFRPAKLPGDSARLRFLVTELWGWTSIGSQVDAVVPDQGC